MVAYGDHFPLDKVFLSMVSINLCGCLFIFWGLDDGGGGIISHFGMSMCVDNL